MLFVNNLDQNGSHEQRLRFLPATCDGTMIAGMCMSEPGAGTRGGASLAFVEEDKTERVYRTPTMCAKLTAILEPVLPSYGSALSRHRRVGHVDESCTVT